MTDNTTVLNPNDVIAKSVRLCFYIIHESDDKSDKLLLAFNIVPVLQQLYGFQENEVEFGVMLGIRLSDLNTYKDKFSDEAREYLSSLFEKLAPKTPFNVLNPNFQEFADRKMLQGYIQATREQWEIYKSVCKEDFQSGMFVSFPDDTDNIFGMVLSPFSPEEFLANKGQE